MALQTLFVFSIDRDPIACIAQAQQVNITEKGPLAVVKLAAGLALHLPIRSARFAPAG
jgi:hypothetical protein